MFNKKQLDRIENKINILLERDIVRESEHKRHESIQRTYETLIVPLLSTGMKMAEKKRKYVKTGKYSKKNPLNVK